MWCRVCVTTCAHTAQLYSFRPKTCEIQVAGTFRHLTLNRGSDLKTVGQVLSSAHHSSSEQRRCHQRQRRCGGRGDDGGGEGGGGDEGRD